MTPTTKVSQIEVVRFNRYKAVCPVKSCRGYFPEGGERNFAYSEQGARAAVLDHLHFMADDRGRNLHAVALRMLGIDR